jgi:hypothetical protein
MVNDETDFITWFKQQYDGMPDPERLQEVKNKAWEHVNALSRLGEEQKELERIQQAWTDCLYAWQAREKDFSDYNRDRYYEKKERE